MTNISTKSKRILADSDFFIALYKKGDSNHEKAKNLLREIESQNIDLEITIFSYGEVTTVLSQRVGHKVAVNFMDDLKEANVKVVWGSEEVFKKAQRIFRNQSSKNVSFVDTLNVAYCKVSNYSQILSFDSGYKKNNLKIFNSK